MSMDAAPVSAEDEPNESGPDLPFNQPMSRRRMSDDVSAGAPVMGAERVGPDGGTHRPGSNSLFAILRNRDFRNIWIGQTVSAVGDQVFPLAVVAEVILRGGGAGGLAAVLAARALASAAMVVVGGLIADRFPRVRVMVGADVLRLVAVLGLAAASHQVPIAGLALLTFLVGIGEAFFRPSYSALMPTILPADGLQRGNALTSLAMKIGTVAGPLLGGVLVASTSAGFAFVVDAATFGVSILTLMSVREPQVERKPREAGLRAVFAESREGIAAVRTRPWLRRGLVIGGIQQIAGIGPVLVLLPVVTMKAFGEAAFGTVLACFGGASILGAVIGGRISTKRPGRVAAVGICAIAAPLLALAGPAPLWVVCAAFIVAGIGMEIFTVLWETALQLDVPEQVLGRVSSLDWLLTFGLMPLGMAIAGVGAGHFSVEHLAWLCAALIIVSGPTLLLVPGGSTMSSAGLTADPKDHEEAR